MVKQRHQNQASINSPLVIVSEFSEFSWNELEFLEAVIVAAFQAKYVLGDNLFGGLR